MQWVKQETDRTCGPSCVAMVAGLTWAEAVAAVGTKGSTYGKRLRQALTSLGVKCGEFIRLKPGQAVSEDVTAIVGLRWPGKRLGHWVVYRNGEVWCPTNGVFSIEEYPEFTKHPKATSYMVTEEAKPDASTDQGNP